MGKSSWNGGQDSPVYVLPRNGLPIGDGEHLIPVSLWDAGRSER